MKSPRSCCECQSNTMRIEKIRLNCNPSWQSTRWLETADNFSAHSSSSKICAQTTQFASPKILEDNFNFFFSKVWKGHEGNTRQWSWCSACSYGHINQHLDANLLLGLQRTDVKQCLQDAFLKSFDSLPAKLPAEPRQFICHVGLITTISASRTSRLAEWRQKAKLDWLNNHTAPQDQAPTNRQLAQKLQGLLHSLRFS